MTPSRLEEQQISWMSQKRVLPEDERRELRIWMRRKHRERLAVYHKHRESLREREHKPFTTSGTVVRYICLFTRNDCHCMLLKKKYYIHIVVRLLCPCRNQQTRIKQPFGEPERIKKSMYLFTLSVHNKHAFA